MIPLLVVHVGVAVALMVLGERVRRIAFPVAGVVAAATVVWTATRIGAVRDGSVPTEHLDWVGALGLGFDFRLDAMAATMLVVLGVVGVAVFWYTPRYFGPTERGLPWLAGSMLLFAGSMAGLVTADNIYVLYVFWEGTTITSYFLIGYHHERPRARAAALQALLITATGGFAMLGGLVLLSLSAGSSSLHVILTGGLPHDGRVAAALGLILFGAFTKSAQYPFHSWLPGAMEAPTPVTSFLHSATMVTAGVYLIARFAPLHTHAAFWRPAVIVVGLASLLFGGLRALRQVDLKLLLAYGTVSQLGLMVVLFGVGTPGATRAGWMLLIAHAAFKAALFMVVGVIDHCTGTRRIGEIPDLGPRWAATRITTGFALASMAGVPLLAGFVAKETGYAAFAGATFESHWLVLAGIVAGSAFTVAYAVRFWFGAFGARRTEPDRAVVSPRRPATGFLAPAAALSAAGVALGFAGGRLDGFADVAARSLQITGSRWHLAAWHGFDLSLGLTTLAILVGLGIVAARRTIQPILASGARLPSGDDLYLGALRATAGVARRVTAVVQNGSLPVYAGVTIAAVLVFPVYRFGTGGSWGGWPRFGSPGEVALVAVLVSAATGAALLRHRFGAAVLLSVVGYAMAGLFVLSGAPDLALTQATVETLSTVVFVLVLRRLPPAFDRTPGPSRRVLRIVIASSVAAAVFVFALVAQGTLSVPAVSNDMIERALPDGHGRNIVNVILVDFRAMDTMGEITVLVAAAIGAVALGRAGRHRPRRPDDPEVVAAAAADARRRIVFVDGTVHIIFPAIMMLSLWLLFAGHNQPGGGFVGGLLAGAAIALRYVAGGTSAVRDQSRFRAWSVLGCGLAVAAVTAIGPLAWGNPILSVASTTLHPPIVGELTLSSALAFDIGVYLVVVGTTMMAFEAFGDDASSEVPT